MSDPEHDSKRKRTPDPELEIDLSLPEPVSKKAKRQEKKSSTKSKSNTKQTSELSLETPDPANLPLTSDAAQPQPSHQSPQVGTKRSDYGIWIGNLAFKTTKESIREFLRKEGQIGEKDITRLHLPTTTKTTAGKTPNKGFAYIDFADPTILSQALQLSERLIDGRKVLIKDAKSFEGRPIKPPTPQQDGVGGKIAAKKQPSRRVFIGNLGFDVTKEEIMELFGRAGEVEDVFLATFEDSGKCKGFGWVRFKAVEAAEAAVKGYVFEEGEDEDEYQEDDVEVIVNEETATKAKKRKRRKEKYFINRLHGRQLRCEFAEDAQTRYKKRFTSKSSDNKGPRDQRGQNSVLHDVSNAIGTTDDGVDTATSVHQDAATRKQQQQLRQNQNRDRDQRREDRRKRHEKLDARQDKPQSQRASGAIVAGVGQRVRFDD